MIAQSINPEIWERVEEVLDEWCDMIGPAPDPRPLEEFAGTLTARGASGQTFSLDPRRARNPDDGLEYTHAAQLAILVAIGALVYRRFVIIGPAQDGKTMAGVVAVILWALIELRRSILLQMPTLELSDDLWRDKILSTMEESDLEHYLPELMGGRGSEMAYSLIFSTGAPIYRVGAGGKNQSNQSSRSTWGTITDERDDVRDEKAEKVKTRTKGQGEERLSIDSSTIKKRKSSTLKLYNVSTQGVIQIPCYHCGVYYEPKWDEHVKIPEGASAIEAREHVRLICPKGCQMTDAERRDSCSRGVYVMKGQSVDKKGRVRGEGPKAAIWGIKWNCLVSPLRSLARLAEEYVDAVLQAEDGQDQALRTFVEDELAEPFELEADLLRALPAHLVDRSRESDYDSGTAPKHEDAPFLVAAIDVQWRELHWVVLAIDPREESPRWWIVDHDTHPFCNNYEVPSEAMVENALEHVWRDQIGKGFARPTGEVCYVTMAGVDVADGRNPNRAAIIDWVTGEQGVHPIHGQSAKQQRDSTPGKAVWMLPGVLSIHEQDKADTPYNLAMINVDNMKVRVVRELAREQGSPNSGMIPRGESADGWLIRELCSEERILNPKTDEYEWVKRTRHNHRLDCTAVGLALAEWYKAALREAEETAEKAAQASSPSQYVEDASR